MFGPTIYCFVLPFAILLYVYTFTFANADKISDKRLCGDRNCQTIISKARTLARHKPTDPAFLPFERGAMINIYSKSAGSRQDLWGGELNGRRGYFPRSFVREYKVENPSPQFVIDTEHHVPLEERLRGTQPPSNPRTVRQDNRPEDTPQQPPTQQDNGQKKEPKESDNKVTEEQADETDIGDETELPDDEPEEAGSPPNTEADSHTDTETSSQTGTETGSPSSTDQASEKESDLPKTDTLEGEKQADVVREDPTEVDDTEIGDEDDERKRDDTEVDETETDETELNDEDKQVQDEEVEKIVVDSHKDGYIDIDKLPEDFSTDIEEEDINFDAIKETLSSQDSEKKKQESQESERKENVDEMQEELDGTGWGKDENNVDKEKEGLSDKKEKEIKGEDRVDNEGGSMFGSIWSDNSEGKIEENEGIDINNITHSENAVDSPIPDINIDDHIDKSDSESIKYGDGTVHVNEYNGDDKGLESKDNEVQNDGKGKNVIKDGDKEQNVDFTNERHKDDAGTEAAENNDIYKTEAVSVESDNELLERDNELSVDDKVINNTQNNNMPEESETTNENQNDDSDISKDEENDDDKDTVMEDDDDDDNDGEDDDVGEEGDDDYEEVEDDIDQGKDILSVSQHHLKDTEEKERNPVDHEKSHEGNQLHDPEKSVDGKENDNVHLKDILKSSIPEGNDVHQYIVEHAVEAQTTLSESLGTDQFNTETSQKATDNGLGEEHDSQEDRGPESSRDERKLEIVHGDDVSIGETLYSSRGQFDRKKEKETILSGSGKEDKDQTTDMPDHGLIDRDEVTQIKDDDKLTDNREKSNAAGELIDSDGNRLVSDEEIKEENTTKDTDTRKGMKLSDTKDQEVPEGMVNNEQSWEQNIKVKDFDIDGNKNKHAITSNDEISTKGIHDSDKSMNDMNVLLNNTEILIESKVKQNDTNDFEEESREEEIPSKQNDGGSFETDSNVGGTTVEVDEVKNPGIKQSIDIKQDTQTEKKAPIAGDESELVGDTGNKVDEAVVSPFQKTETDDSKNVDEQIADPSTESTDNTVNDDTKASDGTPHDEEGTGENVKFESKEDTTNFNEADVNAEQILDNLENIKAMSDVKEEVKDVPSGNQEDDLKFVDSHGDVIPEQVEQEKENVDVRQGGQINVADINVNEMEQGKLETRMGEERQQVDANTEDRNNEQKEIDDKKLEKFEKLASGMMSILATPSYAESKTEFPSSVSDNTVREDVVDEKVDRGEGTTQVINTEVEMSETNVTVESTTEAFQSSVSEPAFSTLVEAADKNIPDQDDTRGGGVVIDGTTFDADYFGDEFTSAYVQATEQIYTTPSDVDNMLRTPLGNVNPTKLFDAPLEIEQTLSPSDAQTNQDIENKKIPYNQQNEQATTFIPENIKASETLKQEPVGQETLEVSVLGTSFGYATPKVEETHTQPIESVTVDSQTQAVDSNETVASDIVQDMVQPSLDQNAYNTETFISRKPLSTEPASAEASAETGIPSQGGIDTDGQQVGQGETNTKPDLDQNNNQIADKPEETKHTTDENNNQFSNQGHQTPDLNNNIPGNVAKDDTKSQDGWTDFSREGNTLDTFTPPTTDTPEQLDPYSSVDHLYSRKIPDAGLDEELRQPDDGFMKMLEPYLKSMINMLPPSLQTVLEQEPLGLSPTLAMLVSLVSTNILALFTCVGCMCKGKKKQSGRKDPLVVIRELEEKLFIATKEKENLEDDIQMRNKKIIEMQDELGSSQSSKGTFETDLKTIKLHNESLKKQLAQLQEELDEYKQEVTEKSQVVVYKDSELQTYLTEIQSLTKRAEDAELAAQKTSQSLSEKNEELRYSLQQIQTLSEQTQQLETSKEQLNTQAVDWSEKVRDLTEQVEQFSTDSKRMQEDLAFKENELEVLRDCFLQVKAFQGEEEMKEDTEDSPDLGEKLKQMMDVSRVNASLRSVEEERDVLQNKLLIEVESRKELEDQVQLLKRKFESNQTDKMKAERQCQEAQTKLEVLSKYFKEKEAELTRQLGEQEVLKNQNMSKLQSSDSITQELSKENESYRQQIEDLKTEISKAERDFRSQIAANEKKAHENWLATRAAERELKESRHECGMLRQKLTDLERKLMQGPPPGLIRPITHRAMPPPGMLNGPPPPPPPERPGSRGSVHGHVTPRLRDDDYRASPIGPERIPPPDRRHPPGPMGPRPPPPPLDAMSPPPYAIRPPFPPDRRSPPSFDRYPPPRGPRPPFPRPPPPHLRSPPPMGSNPSEHDDSKQDPYIRAHPGSRDRGTSRHQSQV